MTNFTSVESKSAQFVTSDAITSAEPANRPRRFKVARPRLDTAAGNAEVPATKDRQQARIVGFGPMSRITTSFGEVYAPTLRAGDRVRCKRAMRWCSQNVTPSACTSWRHANARSTPHLHAL